MWRMIQPKSPCDTEQLPHHHLHHSILSSPWPPPLSSTRRMPTQGQSQAGAPVFWSRRWEVLEDKWRTSVKEVRHWQGSFSSVFWAFFVFKGAFSSWTLPLLGSSLISKIGAVFVSLERREGVESGSRGKVSWTGPFFAIFGSFSMFKGVLES